MRNSIKILTNLKYLSLNGLLMLVFLGMAVPVSAELYKWVDADGNVNYTQSRPPPGVEASTIKPPPSVETGAARDQLEQRIESLDKMAGQRQQQSEELANTETENQQQQQRCSQARARLASYEMPRISVAGADGTPRQLGEDERQRELKKSRNLIRELCK